MGIPLFLNSFTFFSPIFMTPTSHSTKPSIVQPIPVTYPQPILSPALSTAPTEKSQTPRSTINQNIFH